MQMEGISQHFGFSAAVKQDGEGVFSWQFP